MELKTYTPVSLKLVFEETRFKVLHYIQNDFICQHPGISKDQTSMLKALLLTISSSNIARHSNGYRKGYKYFAFFYKSSCDKSSSETKLFTK